MIERTRDAELVNAIGGHDFADFLAEPLHICLVDGANVGFFAWRGPGIYEVHLSYAVRGRDALTLCRAMIETMRAQWGAKLLWALVPIDLRNVRMFARLMGWKSQGMLETRNGPNELFTENGECLQ